MPIITGTKSQPTSIVKPSEVAKPAAVVEVVKTTDPDFKATSVDLKWFPRVNLLTSIEGASWTVDYFSQVLTADSELSGAQLGTDTTYQSYTKITGFELKVSNPLSLTQDEQTGTMLVTGTSVMYPCVIPNVGDMFVADIGEGKRGLFKITFTSKKSIFSEAVYEVNYDLMTDDVTRIQDVEKKVVKTTYFHRDFLVHGQNPVILKNEKDALLDLRDQYDRVFKSYMRRYFSKDMQTLMIPKQVTLTYDSFLTMFVSKNFGVEESPEMVKLKVLNVQADRLLSGQQSILDAISKRDVSVLNEIFTQVGLINTYTFNYDPLMHGIRFSGFEHLVYPKNPVLQVDDLHDDWSKEMILDDIQPSFDPDVPQPVPNAVNDEPDQTYTPSNDPDDDNSYSYSQDPMHLTDPYALPMPTQDSRYAMVKAWNLRNLPDARKPYIHPVTKDTFYIFSRAFYEQTDDQSTFENLVTDYLLNKKLDTVQLLDMCKLVSAWGVVEQFYYIPILLVMIRSTIRGF